VVPVPAYLARIGYSGPTSPTSATLRALHRAHLLGVPFENLDIALGRTIVIDEDAFLRKVVDLRRGGFCYELNGAFAALLRTLGFQVTLLSARVGRKEGGEGPEFDHLTLRVDFPEEADSAWLADVGFGDSFLEPLRLKIGEEQADLAGSFRLTELAERLQMERLEDGFWKRQYSFTLQPRKLEDFAGMCHYHQTSPESPFTKNDVCSRATPEGRITLSGMKLIITRQDQTHSNQTRNGERDERMLGSQEERSEILRGLFGIRL
jgi:N-hydroxyarylamine O-acetyltransferase